MYVWLQLTQWSKTYSCTFGECVFQIFQFQPCQIGDAKGSFPSNADQCQQWGPDKFGDYIMDTNIAPILHQYCNRDIVVSSFYGSWSTCFHQNPCPLIDQGDPNYSHFYNLQCALFHHLLNILKSEHGVSDNGGFIRCCVESVKAVSRTRLHCIASEDFNWPWASFHKRSS